MESYRYLENTDGILWNPIDICKIFMESYRYLMKSYQYIYIYYDPHHHRMRNHFVHTDQMRDQLWPNPRDVTPPTIKFSNFRCAVWDQLWSNLISTSTVLRRFNVRALAHLSARTVALAGPIPAFLF